MESPSLYVLFVCDLIARLNAVQLEQRSPTLGGKEIRALQLADDLALLARCPEDMQKLIDEWERFCDDYHIETQIVKTKSVVFTRADDEDSAVSDDTFLTFNMVRLDAEKERVGFWDDLWFTYKRKRLKVREDFNYLGVLLHWKESAEAAWADRQATAHKAKGALLGSLFMVPFLPFKRMREIATAILGCVYLFGAEVWGPFIPSLGSAPGSKISKDVLQWLTGLGGARTERCRGWVMLAELDVQAESRALRILQDAEKHGGLLERAVRQLHQNCRTAGRQAGSTWFGRLRRRVRLVWPNFRLEIQPSLQLIGIPEDGKLSRQYVIAQWQRLWKERQVKVLRAPPLDSQQDFILYEILRQMTQSRADGSAQYLTEAISPDIDAIGHEHLQTLLRFLSGMADFAMEFTRFAVEEVSRLKR